MSDQTIGNILKRHGIAPAPRRKHTTRWPDCSIALLEVLTELAKTACLAREILKLFVSVSTCEVSP